MTPLGPSPGNSWRVSDTHADLVRVQAPARPLLLDALPKPVTIDLARTGIIVIDMQNDFCHPDGWLASIGVDISEARAPIAPLVAVLPRLRAAGVLVIWVNWGTRPDRLNLSPALRHVYDPAGRRARSWRYASKGTGAPVLQAGSPSAQIVVELGVSSADIHVAKHRMSGFWDTPLDAILRQSSAGYPAVCGRQPGPVRAAYPG